MQFTKQERELIQAALCSHMVKLHERAKAAKSRGDIEAAFDWSTKCDQACVIANRFLKA